MLDFHSRPLIYPNSLRSIGPFLLPLKKPEKTIIHVFKLHRNIAKLLSRTCEVVIRRFAELKILSTAIILLISFACHAQAVSLPSFWCSFTEPFITVSTARNGIYFDDNDQRVGFARRPTVQKNDADIVLSGRLKGGSGFTLTINKDSGSDGMSEFDYPYVGKLSGAASVIGGCVRMPEGTQMRRVVDVAKNDQLNLRSQPNASAKIIGAAYAKSFVWAKPVALKKGWARVAAVLRPKNEQGLITFVEGWVNAKFLGAVEGK
jgi:uncharacterized membrane protein